MIYVSTDVMNDYIFVFCQIPTWRVRERRLPFFRCRPKSHRLSCPPCACQRICCSISCARSKQPLDSFKSCTGASFDITGPFGHCCGWTICSLHRRRYSKRLITQLQRSAIVHCHHAGCDPRRSSDSSGKRHRHVRTMHRSTHSVVDVVMQTIIAFECQISQH